MFGEALSAAGRAMGDDTRIEIGTQVEIKNPDYWGETGEVVGHRTNMLGAPLVDVKLPSGSTPCFYPHELTPMKGV